MVHENTLLSLDVTKAYKMLDWEAKLSFYEAIEYTVDWYKEALHNDDMFEFCKKQIQSHMGKGYLWDKASQNTKSLTGVELTCQQ